MAAVSTALALGTAQYISAQNQASGQRAQGRFRRQQAAFNSRQSERQALDAIKRGEKRVVSSQQQTAQLVGEQRAVLAAQGIQVDDGVALAIQEQSRDIGMQDALTIKNNAIREAFGFEAQALDFRTQGSFAEAGANLSAANTLLSGSLQSFGTFGQAAIAALPKRSAEPDFSLTNKDVRDSQRTPFSGGFGRSNFDPTGVA